MSSAHVSARIEVADRTRTHTWADSHGDVCSSLDLGFVSITFDSAEEAEQISERCTAIAAAIRAMQAEMSAATAASGIPL